MKVSWLFVCLFLIMVYLVSLFVLFVFVFMVSISSLFIIRKTLKGTTRLLQTTIFKGLEPQSFELAPKLNIYSRLSCLKFICKYYQISHQWYRAFLLWLRLLNGRLVHTLLSLTILLFVRTYQRLGIFPFLLKKITVFCTQIRWIHNIMYTNACHEFSRN